MFIRDRNSTYSTTGDGANSSEYVDSLISYKRSSGGSGGRGRAPGHGHHNHHHHQQQANGGEHPASGRAKARAADWSTAIDSELAVAMNEHHMQHLQQQQHHGHHHGHHHQHHHHHNHRAAAATPMASAIGGLPLGAAAGLMGPRARLASSRPNETHDKEHELDPNTEVHSDNEIFGDEEEDDDEMVVAHPDDAEHHRLGDGISERDASQQQHIMIEQHHVSGAGLKQLGSANPGVDRRRQNQKQHDSSSVQSADRSIYSGESNWDSNDDETQHRMGQQHKQQQNNRSHAHK
jgi:hypothetical protein